MVNASHARCKQCGQARHKIARFNLCQKCWEETKPSVRQYWRGIKERRRLRREIDAHIAATVTTRAEDPYLTQTPVQQAEPAVMDAPEPLTAEERRREIERIRAAGLPPRKTPEWTRYIRLFRELKEPEQAAAEPVARLPRGRPPARTPEQETEIIRLYQDHSVPVEEILHAYNLTEPTLNRLRQKHGVEVRRPTPTTPNGVAHLVAAEAPQPASGARRWAITFSATRVIHAATIDQAMNLAREQYGGDMDIEQIVRA